MAEVYWVHLKEHTDIFSEGYVGFTSKTSLERFKTHLETVNCKREKQNHFYSAIRKYGVENIVLTTVCICEDSYGLWLENKLRPAVKIGWNMVEGGGKPPSALGKTFPNRPPKPPASEATKAKMRESWKLRKPLSQEVCKRIGDTLRGRKLPRAVIEKMMETRGSLPCYLTFANHTALLVADKLYSLYEEGLPPNRTLSSRFSITRCVLQLMWKKFSVGWNPQADPAWIGWSSANAYSIFKPIRVSADVVKKRVTMLSKWKQGSNLDVWATADEYYTVWVSRGNPSDKLLGKIVGVDRNRLKSLCRHFKNGWIPNQDEEFISWKNEYLNKKGIT